MYLSHSFTQVGQLNQFKFNNISSLNSNTASHTAPLYKCMFFLNSVSSLVRKHQALLFKPFRLDFLSFENISVLFMMVITSKLLYSNFNWSSSRIPSLSRPSTEGSLYVLLLVVSKGSARYDKSLKPFADTFLRHLIFLQNESLKFPQLCMACQWKYPLLGVKVHMNEHFA